MKRGVRAGGGWAGVRAWGTESGTHSGVHRGGTVGGRGIGGGRVGRGSVGRHRGVCGRGRVLRRVLEIENE